MSNDHPVGEYSVRFSPAESFRSINARHQYTWCDVLWNESGRVIIVSDHGTWSHFWGHRGEKTVAKFLVMLDRDYMGQKMLGGNYLLSDPGLTATEVFSEVYRMTTSGELDGDESDFEQSLAGMLSDGEISIDTWLGDTNLDDAIELVRKSPCRSWVNFWERLWVPLVLPELQRIALNE